MHACLSCFVVCSWCYRFEPIEPIAVVEGKRNRKVSQTQTDREREWKGDKAQLLVKMAGLFQMLAARPQGHSVARRCRPMTHETVSRRVVREASTRQ